MVSIRIPEDIELDLDVLTAERIKKNDVFLSQHEVVEDYYLAAEAYAEFKANNEQSLSVEDVVKNLGLGN